MLPTPARLTRREDFTTAVHRGRRAAAGSLVVHLACAGRREPARIGFVVSRAVGGSVVRHRVQRRLRHLVRAALDRLPDGALIVVRALPASANMSSAMLRRDLHAALRRLLPTGDRQ